MQIHAKNKIFERRKMHIRNRISGTPERPRLTVCKTGKHIYAQIVDDKAGKTLAFATTNTKANKETAKSFANIKNAEAIGIAIAAAGKKAGVSKVVFDRAGRTYHGVIKALAEAARKGGLEF
ncbi:50S ribosomal protein L18 [Candidatus Sumerlaeota bacterium]|nr:50S ribosomal protein L18 [Candidatus Sumerlaeales bacterium]NLD61055.1 50S ribosomal protein L18 [Candidatus Sumerlaeota bacterium]